MKAILKFQLPEESHEFANATQGAKMRSALWDTRDKLIDKLKTDGLTKREYKLLRELLDDFLEILEDQNIDLDQ